MTTHATGTREEWLSATGESGQRLDWERAAQLHV